MGEGLVAGSYSQAQGEASMFSLMTPIAGDAESTKEANQAAFRFNAQTLFAFGVSTAFFAAKILVFVANF